VTGAVTIAASKTNETINVKLTLFIPHAVSNYGLYWIGGTGTLVKS
jgi:hypothetical protein